MDKKYGVAVQDVDGQLYLVLRIRRYRGNIYVLFPRPEPTRCLKRTHWDPHTSYHASGEYHHKSFKRKLWETENKQKPDDRFVGTENIVTMGIATGESRAINVPCDLQEFVDALVIPVTLLSPKRYQTLLSVDLAEPEAPPIITPGGRILKEMRITDAIPHIIVTFFRTDLKSIAVSPCMYPKRPFDKLRANGTNYKPFVVSLSNHRLRSVH